MAATERYGLNRFGGSLGGDLSDEGYKFTNRDRTTIDRVLAALEGHRHSGGNAEAWDNVTAYGTGQLILPTVANGHVYVAVTAGISASSEPAWPTGPAATVADGTLSWQEAGNEQTSQLLDPIDLPGLSASASPLGTLPAGTDLFYRVGWVDSYGLETAASPEASIATPDPLDTPDVPAGLAVAGGDLEDGNFYYAVSFYQTTGNLETETSDTTYVTCGQGDNTVELELPPLPAEADGWKIYRLGPAEADLYLLATQPAASGTSFVDDGSIAISDPVQLAPLENTTNSQNAVEVVCPGAASSGAVPSGVRRWRIYRSETSGDYPDESLVHEVVETTTQGGTILVTSWIDLGDPLEDGIPLDTSTAFIPPGPSATAPRATDVSFDDTGLVVIDAGNVQDALEEVDAALAGMSSSGGHPASQITFTPTGAIAASNVQGALAEVDTEKQGHGTATPLSDSGSGVVGTSALGARQDHRHPLGDLDSLSDVTVSSPANGQLLRHNGTSWANVTPGYVTATGGGQETLQAHGAMGATETIDLANGNLHTGTLDANCTLTFTGATNSKVCALTLTLTQDATGSRIVTWPGAVKWAAGTAPTLTTTASRTDIFTFFTTDGGSVWYGFTAGLNFS